MAATDIIFSGLYYAVGSSVQVTIGGLYCGSFTVVAPGTITVPINSDPDALCNGKYLQTLDVGPWDKFPTITNSAELVVSRVIDLGLLVPGERLIYRDSEGDLAELTVKDDRFAGFRPFQPAEVIPE